MALSRITKVGGNSLESPLNFTGIVSATSASFSGVQVPQNVLRTRSWGRAGVE